jgi:group I intron endonuclease
MCGIYKIENLINGKIYIGKSVNIKNRFQNHKSESFNEKSNAYDTAIHRAIRKYGIESFSFEVIEKCSREDLSNREKYWIEFYNSFGKGYNLTLGGEGVPTANEKQIRELWDEGLSIGEIFDKTKYNKHTIINILQNYPKYSRKESNRRGRINAFKNKIRPVIQYDYDGEFVQEYSSAKEASKISGINDNLIRACLCGEQKSAGHYQWRYKFDDAPLKYEPKTENQKKPVLQFDKNRNLIAEYCSISEAAKSVGLSNPTSIIISCKSKTRTASGYIWRYKDSNN